MKGTGWHSLVRRLGASRPGAWSFARLLHHVDRAVLGATGGRTTLTSLLTGLPVLFITTVGARSGRPRRLPLLYIRDDDDPTAFALIASNFGQRHNPAWYYNLQANPRATCEIAGRTGVYIAHEATGAEYEKFWRRGVRLYKGYARYKERAAHRHIPIMVLTPDES